MYHHMCPNFTVCAKELYLFKELYRFEELYLFKELYRFKDLYLFIKKCTIGNVLLAATTCELLSCLNRLTLLVAKNWSKKCAASINCPLSYAHIHT